MIRVFFRACDLVKSVHNVARPYGLVSKLDTIKVSFESLVRALRCVDYEIVVLGDRLSNKALDFFNEYDEKVHVDNRVLGSASASLRLQIQRAIERSNDGEFVYLCEDDYLHKEETFSSAMEIYRLQSERVYCKRGILNVEMRSDHDLILYFADYPDRYKKEFLQPCMIYASSDRHWRQITNTTHTIFMRSEVLRKYARIFFESSIGPSDARLSKALYANKNCSGRALCLSPMPSLTTHLTEGVVSPFVDWEGLIDGLRE